MTNSNPDNADFLEEIKANLLQELRHTLEPLALSDLASVTDAQEEVLRLYLEDTIASNCHRLFHEAEWDPRERRVVLASKHYELVVRESLPQQDRLEIWLLQRDLGSRPPRPRAQTFCWNASGKYVEASLYIAPGIKANRSLLAEIVEAVFATGYRWYEEQLHALISDDKVTAVRLYSFLRTVITDEAALRRMWLVAADPDFGCYLVDDGLAAAALARVRPKAVEVGKSAIRILAEFLTSTLPFELTHSRTAVMLGHCIDVSLEDSRYSSERALLMIAEISFYGSPLISIFPIVWTGKAYLLAVFPTEDRSYIEPILSRHRRELEAEFKRFRSSLARLLVALRRKKRGLMTSEVGDFTGGMLVGIVKSLLGP